MNFVKNSRPPGFDSLQQQIDAYGCVEVCLVCGEMHLGCGKRCGKGAGLGQCEEKCGKIRGSGELWREGWCHNLGVQLS